MKTFSQRKGLKPASEVIQADGMNDELRISLWNVLDLMIWSTDYYLLRSSHGVAGIEPFSSALWFSYFKKPIDSRPDRSHAVLATIRDNFFTCEWFEVYDFIEFVVGYYERDKPGLVQSLNLVLQRELSAYRIVKGHVTDITSVQELEMLDQAISDSRFTSVAAHLKRALELYAARESPDYRNSIKESISAVEAMARIVAENPKATLGDALKAIERRGALHSALKEGFSKLYGYTSDEGGIRHAMLDKPNLTAADARYFLLSCTSFSNYLKSQL